jgi:hypothetical protein
LQVFAVFKVWQTLSHKHLNKCMLKVMKSSVMDLCPPHLRWGVKLHPLPHISIFLSSPSDIHFTWFWLVDIGKEGLKKSVVMDRHWAALSTAIYFNCGTSHCGMTVVFGISEICPVFFIIWIWNNKNRKFFCKHGSGK